MFWKRQNALDDYENQSTELEEFDSKMKFANWAQREAIGMMKPSLISRISAWMLKLH